jgi:hypothetical protein
MKRIDSKIKNELATLTATCSGSEELWQEVEYGKDDSKKLKYAGNTDCYLQWFRRTKARSRI